MLRSPALHSFAESRHLGVSLSLSRFLCFFLSLSLSHTHTLYLSLSLSLTHTHTHTLTLSHFTSPQRVRQGTRGCLTYPQFLPGKPPPVPFHPCPVAHYLSVQSPPPNTSPPSPS